MSKNYYLIIGIAALIIIGLVWIGFTNNKPSVPVNPDNLPGIQKGNVPWPAELNHLKERLSAINLPALSEEGSVMHIHEHLDIFIDGKPVSVPAGIGVNEPANFISPIHTHDNDAIIHVESPTIQKFTLGQFFDIWGVRFTANCIGGYCADSNKALKVYVNGNLSSGDPRQIELQERQEIVVVFGTPDESPKPIPATYEFPLEL